MSLIEQIQADAINSAVDLPDLLRKCKVLAAKLKHAQFSEWISNELNGYENDVALPAYRTIKTHSSGHFTGPYGQRLNNAPIARVSLPEKFRDQVDKVSCRQSVSALGELLSSGKAELHAKWAADIVVYCQHHAPIYEGMTLLDAWRIVGRADIKAVLDTVRTRILDFVLIIGERAPEAGEVPPGAAPAMSNGAVTQIFNTTIYGGQSSIGTSGGSVQLAMGDGAFSPAIPRGEHQELRAQLDALRTKLAELSQNDRGDALDALEKVETELASSTPDTSRIERQLSLLGNITTVVQPHVGAITDLLARIAGM